MTKLIIIRHGQTEWNLSGRYQGQSDIKLTDIGIKQAQCLAENFPVSKIDIIFSSDLQRAAITAKMISDHFNCPVIKDSAFREISFGQWEGHTYNEIIEQWPEALNYFFTSPDRLNIPLGETFPEVQDRAMGKISEIMNVYPDKTVVIVSHGAIIRTILSACLHTPLKYLWSFQQDNTAVNIINYADNNFYIETLNNTSHLAEADLHISTII